MTYDFFMAVVWTNCLALVMKQSKTVFLQNFEVIVSWTKAKGVICTCCDNGMESLCQSYDRKTKKLTFATQVTNVQCNMPMERLGLMVVNKLNWKKDRLSIENMHFQSGAGGPRK